MLVQAKCLCWKLFYFYRMETQATIWNTTSLHNCLPHLEHFLPFAERHRPFWRLDFTHSLPPHICVAQSVKIDWQRIYAAAVSRAIQHVCQYWSTQREAWSLHLNFKTIGLMIIKKINKLLKHKKNRVVDSK